MIKVQNITKNYGKTRAVRGISFEVRKGELFGLIGPDGAGKTTVFHILTTLLKPDSGKAEVMGLNTVADFRKIRAEIGYMPGRFALYRDLSVRENLQFFASVFGSSIDANYDLIKPIYSRLEPFRDRLAGDLSGGMKQKLALCCALVHRPPVLFLDEPTTGVDAVSRKEFWQMLHSLKRQGITLLVSTPYMDEAEQCNRIALMQEGELFTVDTPAKVTSLFDKELWSVRAADKYKLIQLLRGYKFSESVRPFGESVHYTDRRRQFDIGELHSYLEEQGSLQAETRRVTPTIEDVFMRFMKKGGSDE